MVYPNENAKNTKVPGRDILMSYTYKKDFIDYVLQVLFW